MKVEYISNGIEIINFNQNTMEFQRNDTIDYFPIKKIIFQNKKETVIILKTEHQNYKYLLIKNSEIKLFSQGYKSIEEAEENFIKLSLNFNKK